MTKQKRPLNNRDKTKNALLIIVTKQKRHARYQCQDNLDFINRLSGIMTDYLHIESRVFCTQGTSVKIIWILSTDYLE